MERFYKRMALGCLVCALLSPTIPAVADQLGSAYGLVEQYINGSGVVAGDIDLDESRIYDSGGPLILGADGTSSHSLVSGDVLVGGNLEVNSNAYFDSNIYLPYGVYFVAPTGEGFMASNSSQTNKCLQFMTSGTVTGGNYVLVAEFADRNTDFGIDVKTDPSIVAQSADTTDITQRTTLAWNRLALGGDGGGLGCINQTFAYDGMVDGGGADGTLDLDEGIPDGAVVQQAILHSLTGFTGDTGATITIGDGVDPVRYNTGTPSVFTTNASGADLGVPSGTKWHDAAATVTVTVTATGAGDFTLVSAGEATISICYWTP